MLIRILKRNLRLGSYAVASVLLLVTFTILPVSAQLSQWRSLNPTRDGTLDLRAPYLYSVKLLAPNYGWAVGGNCTIYGPSEPAPPCGGFALFWDGARWRQVLIPASSGTLTSVFIVSPNDVWAVGTRNVTNGIPTILHWDGIGWVQVASPLATLTQVRDLFGVFMLPTGASGWVIGTADGGGTNILRWSGMWPSGSFSPSPALGAPDVLRSVSLLSSTHGWIVGSQTFANPDNDPSIYRWDGAGWLSTATEAPPPGSHDLLSVYPISTSEAWAVGMNSTIVKWNGASWTGPMVAPTSVAVDYRSVHMINSTYGWIAGTLNPTTGEGVLLRWNGVAWSIVRSWVTVDLNDVFLLPGGTQGTAAGDAETIIAWKGVRWDAQTSPTYTGLRDVFMAGPDDGWAVGLGGRILRYNGVSWHHYETLPSGAGLFGLYMLNSNDGWAVGQAPGAVFPPTILRWNGAVWSVVTPTGVALGDTLQDVYMLSSTEGWAVGGGFIGPTAHTTMLKWDGSLWTSVPSGAPTNSSLNAVHMLSPTEGWAVGFGDSNGTLPLIVRWNGAAWSVVTPPAGIAGLNDLYMLSPTDGWAVGFGASDGQATIIHWDGTQWRRVPGPVIGPFTGNLTAVKMVTATDGWAVGRDLGNPLTPRSLIAHWDGVTWNVVATLPVPPTLNLQLDGLFMTGPLDGWTVGEEGIILHYGPDAVLTTITSTVTSTAVVTTTAVVTSTTATATTTPPAPEPAFYWWWLFLLLPLAVLFIVLLLLLLRRRGPAVHYAARPVYRPVPSPT